MFSYSSYGTAFARGVSTLEKNNNFFIFINHPMLKFNQFFLKFLHARFILNGSQGFDGL